MDRMTDRQIRPETDRQTTEDRQQWGEVASTEYIFLQEMKQG
jgi:hypothetical protein